MDPVTDLADALRTPTASRVVSGTVVSVTDATHVQVQLGDVVVGAYWPTSLGTAAVLPVRVRIGDGVTEIVSAARPAASTITNASGSTINVASFTSSGYSKSGFTSQDTQLVAYSEDVIADAVNANTGRIGSLETKLNAVLAALRAAGLVA